MHMRRWGLFRQRLRGFFTTAKSVDEDFNFPPRLSGHEHNHRIILMMMTTTMMMILIIITIIHHHHNSVLFSVGLRMGIGCHDGALSSPLPILARFSLSPIFSSMVGVPSPAPLSLVLSLRPDLHVCSHRVHYGLM